MLALKRRLKQIVCDESALASNVGAQTHMLNLLGDLQRELGVSFLFITRNIVVLEYIADQVTVMRPGRITEQGDSAEVLERPVHDYTRGPMAAVLAIPCGPMKINRREPAGRNWARACCRQPTE